MPALDDAIDLLDEDHKHVERLFQQYKSAPDASRKRVLAQQIFSELTVHTRIEEDVFYPAFRQATGDQQIVQESTREHREAMDLVQRMSSAQVDDKLMLALEDAILHHVQDEREKMFPMARKAKGLDLAHLARQLQARKNELMAAHA
jgi:iron-sulfur cluster repair protein YtfE (RIC family)